MSPLLSGALGADAAGGSHLFRSSDGDFLLEKSGKSLIARGVCLKFA